MTDGTALRHHGDDDVRPGDLDFAVNVRGDAPPRWLADRLVDRIGDLGSYPSQSDRDRAVGSIADRHGVAPEHVLPLSGSAEGFHLVAALAARRGLRAAVVHPSFTEPEAELRGAVVPVQRVILPPPYSFDPDLVPADAGLVVVGNPTNPTSVLHPRAALAALCRPGRITVVDEAFADILPADVEAAATLCGADLPGLVVLRSLTKTWALAGLRVGYAVGDPEVLRALSALRPHWPVGTLALEALSACTGPEADGELERIRAEVAVEREAMLSALGEAGIEVEAPPSAPFVLVRVPDQVDGALFRGALAGRGVAVRRCDTFPGLDDRRLRLAVRPGTMVVDLVAAWKNSLGECVRTETEEQR